MEIIKKSKEVILSVLPIVLIATVLGFIFGAFDTVSFLLFIFIDSLMKNLEQNLGIVSNLLSICITKIKHKFKKVMKNEDNNKDKILLLLTKLFYKNLIANNLSTMFTDSYGERIIKVLLNEYIKNIAKILMENISER